MKPTLKLPYFVLAPLALFVFALALATPVGTASALALQEDEEEPECNPGRGGTLFSANKDVSVEILPGNPGASFTSDLSISVNRRTMNFGSSREAGRVTRIGRVKADTELVFHIKVRQTGNTFYTGPGDRNPDGVPHADVECMDDGKINVSFEDLINGGDESYNDLRFQVRLKPLCSPDQSQEPEPDAITHFPECKSPNFGRLKVRWGRFGDMETLESDKGEKLELHCMPADIPTYMLFYTKPGGEPRRVGICPFGEGSNIGIFKYVESANDDNNKPDCFTSIKWTSKDYGENDNPNGWTNLPDTTPVLDHAISFYDVLNDNLIKINQSYLYAKAPPIENCVPSCGAEGAEAGIRVVSDPPLGPITEAFFAAVFARLQKLGKPSGPMTADPSSPADLDRDGKLDTADRAIFDAAFGTCFGRSPAYRSAADFNADSCITLDDEETFLGIFRAGTQQNAPPIAKCADVTRAVPADSCAVTINARDLDFGSSDPDGDALTLSLGSPATFGPGTHKATLVVTDARGARSSCVSNVTVADQTPPSIGQPSVSPPVLSPPNHKMVEVAVSYRATDNCAAAVNTSLSVTSNEPVDERGSGSTSPDWEVVDARRVRLRAERAGGGAGRVYTVTITATDGAGNTSRRSVEVPVPHN